MAQHGQLQTLSLSQHNTSVEDALVVTGGHICVTVLNSKKNKCNVSVVVNSACFASCI